MRFAYVLILCASPAAAYNVTKPEARKQSLLEYP